MGCGKARFRRKRRKRYHVHNDVSQVLFTEQEIARRVAQIGADITRDYAAAASDGIVLISVLRGAAIFMADLARAVELPLEMDYMAVSSYGNGAKSSGVVRILKDLSTEIEGRHVIIAEDIIDSGLTLAYLMKNLASRNPASIEVAALLRKKTPAQAEIDCRYVGFECPDEFIVGYGLDYAERYRNLPCIGVLKPEIYQ
ncbi:MULTISPECIES: hypoxanthine phosphoribosyltransferase [unclassified Adlercreutzia]|uniref:hypoxanthine phosphoribosyltransferase n=1 Tax=unclassified Adlercreutzia TaxID=2636013 RepID=UPI001981D9C9